MGRGPGLLSGFLLLTLSLHTPTTCLVRTITSSIVLGRPSFTGLRTRLRSRSKSSMAFLASEWKRSDLDV